MCEPGLCEFRVQTPKLIFDAAVEDRKGRVSEKGDYCGRGLTFQ
jgi:hypothetical protein